MLGQIDCFDMNQIQALIAELDSLPLTVADIREQGVLLGKSELQYNTIQYKHCQTSFYLDKDQ